MRRRFERAASRPERYERASWLQREIAGRTAERLEYIKLEPRVVVDAGAGNGHALALLGDRFADAHLIAVDAVTGQLRSIASPASSPSPLERLKRWIGPTSGRRTRRPSPVAADFAHLPLAAGSVGCVWSNLALQWATDPPAVFAEWHRVLETGGLVLFTSLGPDTLKELRAAWASADEAGTGASNRAGRGSDGSTPNAGPERRAEAAAWSRTRLPPPDRVHPFIDMHDIGDMLIHAGFADPVMDMETVTLTYRDLDGLIADLRDAGAAGSHAARPRGLTGRRRWDAMRRAYEAMRRDDGQLPATFEIIYGHAWKPAPRVGASVDGVARVRIEDIGGLSGTRQV